MMRFSITITLQGGHMMDGYRKISRDEAIEILEGVIDLLKNTDEEVIIYSEVFKDRTNSKRCTVGYGIDLVKQSKSVFFSQMPMMGSMDLVEDIVRSNERKTKNLLFPIAYD